MKTILLLSVVIYVAIAKPQISFGEEEETAKPVEPASSPTGSQSTESNDDVVHTRLGLLAGYLSKTSKTCTF